jgi:hypothetical protein
MQGGGPRLSVQKSFEAIWVSTKLTGVKRKAVVLILRHALLNDLSHAAFIKKFGIKKSNGGKKRSRMFHMRLRADHLPELRQYRRLDEGLSVHRFDRRIHDQVFNNDD